MWLKIKDTMTSLKFLYLTGQDWVLGGVQWGVDQIKESANNLMNSPYRFMPVLAFDPALMYANFTIVVRILMAISILLGLILFLSSLFQFKKHGEMRSGGGGQSSIGGPLLMLISGAMLLSLPVVIEVFLYSIWGDSNPMRYIPTNSTYSSLFRVVVLFVQVIGVGSLIRGIMLLARSGSSGQQSQPGTMGKAFVHIFGGILCINVVGSYNILHYLFFGNS